MLEYDQALRFKGWNDDKNPPFLKVDGLCLRFCKGHKPRE